MESSFQWYRIFSPICHKMIKINFWKFINWCCGLKSPWLRRNRVTKCIKYSFIRSTIPGLENFQFLLWYLWNLRLPRIKCILTEVIRVRCSFMTRWHACWWFHVFDFVIVYNDNWRDFAVFIHLNEHLVHGLRFSDLSSL